MKRICFLFFISSAFIMLLICLNAVVKNDIFSLIKLETTENKYTKIIENVQQKISKNIAFLSTNPKLLETLSKEKDFENFSLKHDFDLELLKNLKIASLNHQTYLEITKKTELFFKQSAENFLNPFVFKIDSKDLLNLSTYSSFLKQNNFEFELESGMIFTEFEGKKYYFANAKLSNYYDSKNLLNALKNAKNHQKNNDEFLSFGNEIFASNAKIQGNKESIIFSGISVICIVILMYFSFHSWHILKLLLVVFYSFLSGISAAFLIFKELHILSIITSISLIGLVLDFSMHWLSDNITKPIKPKEIFKFIKIFLTGFIITSGGYGFFLFSGLEFLRQIAVISIFGLLGAFLITLFLLPFLFENVELKPHKIFLNFIEKLLIFYNHFANYRNKIILILSLFILVVFVVFLPKQNFSDDIKRYSTISQEILKDTKRFLEITRKNPQTNFLILNSKNENIIDTERSLMQILKEKNLIQDYDGISKFFLSENEQKNLQQILQENQNNLIESFKNIGLKENFILHYLKEIQNIKPLSINEINNHLNTMKNHQIDMFFVSNNSSIIFLENPKVNAEFKEILKGFNAHFIDQSFEISKYFTEAKKHAIFLKIYAFLFAFIVLYFIFNFKTSANMIGIILFSSLLSITILLLCGIELNIFSIFGLILASSIGVDYVIFAKNKEISEQKRFFGIILANLTTFISFIMLCFSQTYAIFSFGISVSLCLAICAFFALSLVIK